MLLSTLKFEALMMKDSRQQELDRSQRQRLSYAIGNRRPLERRVGFLGLELGLWLASVKEDQLVGPVDDVESLVV